jgi:hypothetical protein
MANYRPPTCTWRALGHRRSISLRDDKGWRLTFADPLSTLRQLQRHIAALSAPQGIYAPRMPDIEVIDSQLRLLLAIRRTLREAEGRPPSTARIDALLDERPVGNACSHQGAQLVAE